MQLLHVLPLHLWLHPPLHPVTERRNEKTELGGAGGCLPCEIAWITRETMGKYGKIMGRYGKIIGNHGKIWENHGKKWRNSTWNFPACRSFSCGALEWWLALLTAQASMLLTKCHFRVYMILYVHLIYVYSIYIYNKNNNNNNNNNNNT